MCILHKNSILSFSSNIFFFATLWLKRTICRLGSYLAKLSSVRMGIFTVHSGEI